MTTSLRTILHWIAGTLLLLVLFIQVKPYLSPYFTNQGLQLVDKKNYNEAMFFLNVANFLNPRDDKVHYSLAEIFYDKRLYNLALNHLKEAIKSNANYSKSHLLAGKIFQDIHQYELALNELAKAYQLDPANRELAKTIDSIKKIYAEDQINKAAVYYSQANIPESQMSLKKAFELSHNTLFNLFLIESQIPEQKDIQSQVDKLQLLSRIDPQRFSIYRLIADTLMENHDFKKAVDYYKKCLSDQPSNVALRNNLGVAYFQSQQYEDATREFRVALSFQPDNYQVIYGLARCYEMSQLTQESLRLYQYLSQATTEMP